VLRHCRWGCSHVVGNSPDLAPLTEIQEKVNVLYIINASHEMEAGFPDSSSQTAILYILLVLFSPLISTVKSFSAKKKPTKQTKGGVKLYFRRLYKAAQLAHLTQLLQVHFFCLCFPLYIGLWIPVEISLHAQQKHPFHSRSEKYKRGTEQRNLITRGY